MYKKIISVMSVALVVFLCSSFPVFANNTTTYSDAVGLNLYESTFVIPITDDNNGVTGFCSATVFPAINIRDVDIEYSYVSSNQMASYNASANYDCMQRIRVFFTLENWSTKPVYIPQNVFAMKTDITVDSHSIDNWTASASNGRFQYAYEVNVNEGDFTFLSSNPNGYNYFLVTDSDHLIGGSTIIPGGERIYISYDIDYYFNATSGFSNSTIFFNPTGFDFLGYQDMSFTHYDGDQLTSNIPNLLSLIARILNNQNSDYQTNADLSNDVTSGSNSLEQQSGQQHQTELSYYNQTNAALNSTGIGNYSFNQEQIGGIGGVSNDFTAVFNSLGSWNTVYIFSLTLGLALMIIRHVRPIRRSKA